MSPLIERREYVDTHLSLATDIVRMDRALLRRAREFEVRELRSLDALHLASAERGRAEWFVTCDDRILKRARTGKLDTSVTVGTPVEFVATRNKGNG